jgi:predicted permease
MRPDDHELDDEIRSHIAISVRERIAGGDDPETARLAALREFGNVTLTRETIRDVWRPRWIAAAAALIEDIHIARRSLMRAKGFAVTVIATLALGIGAIAAIFSVVREVLLRPLVNEDANRLVYIRQSAPGIGSPNKTFSIPEIDDFRARAKTVTGFGDFSTVDLTMVGLGEPRVVKAGVVDGSFFSVMGLHPVFGRLLDEGDDGPDAAPVAVVTHRFWSTSLGADPGVVGRTIRLDTRTATIVGVLEPSVPYPADTELIANVVTSPHHLEATMVTGRTHRMTELFARLAPGSSQDDAVREITAVHAEMMTRYPDAYPPQAGMQISVTPLREQIASPARTMLLLLLAAAGVVFAIACSNVANLILARTARREKELQVRAALGASTAALRRTLLGESLVLCGCGAIVGVVLARPLVGAIGQYASRFSIRALDATVDASVLWVGAGLAMVAAVVLAYVPRLPSARAASAAETTQGSIRIAPGTHRRLRAFAVAQIALSFVLLAGAGTLLSALLTQQRTETGFEMHKVLAIDVPMPIQAFGPKAIEFLRLATREIEKLPGVSRVSFSNFVPWRDTGVFAGQTAFAVDADADRDAPANHYGRLRLIGPGYFQTLGLRLVAGRDFNEQDARGKDLVVIVSQSVAAQAFADGNALGRHLWWTDAYFGKPQPRRIVGIVADVDDEHIVPSVAHTIYHPVSQMPFSNRVFVRAEGDPHLLVPEVTRIIHRMSADQPVERAATLAEIRDDVLGPDRLRAFVFAVFASVALLIAVVGIAGVLAFSVSARTREFGVLLALGSTPAQLMRSVLRQGVRIVAIGIATGAVCGLVLVAASRVELLPASSMLPLGAAAFLLTSAAVVAALVPAARASRVDVVTALRSE